ncbi:hypothetical protein [Eubacterium maltosivorans]|nr:hypothetical protein [Eubacterium maltosivorans]
MYISNQSPVFGPLDFMILMEIGIQILIGQIVKMLHREQVI